MSVDCSVFKVLSTWSLYGYDCVVFFFFFLFCVFFFFQAEDGIRDLVRSRGLGDVYKRQILYWSELLTCGEALTEA